MAMAKAMANAAPPPASELARSLLSHFDRDRTGRVTAPELDAALRDPSVRRRLGWGGTGEQLVRVLNATGGAFGLSQLVRWLEAKEVFDRIDAAGRGGFSMRDLEAALRRSNTVRRRVGVGANQVDDKRLVQKVWLEIDSNNSGNANLMELFQYLEGSRAGTTVLDADAAREQWGRLWAALDRRRAGVVSSDDLARLLRDDPSARAQLQIRARDAELWGTAIDTDGDGRISQSEFRAFCRALWVFSKLDSNGSGFIDQFEWGEACCEEWLQWELGLRSASGAQQLFRQIAGGKPELRFSRWFMWVAAQREPQGPSPRRKPAPAAPRGRAAYEGWKVVGQGAFGKVYRVQRRTDGLDCCIKEPLEASDDVRTEEAMLRRLRHPHIVRLVDSFWEGRRLLLVMDFCAGGDLFHYYQKAGGRLHQGEAARIFDHVLQGMIYLHHEGVLHRDLKPANILLTQDKTAKVADFGLSKNVERAITVCGTLIYMAPEVLDRSRSYGQPNDVWALGCILYEITHGSFAFRSPAQVVQGRPPNCAGAWCEALILAALAYNPDRRPTCGGLRAMLPRGGGSGVPQPVRRGASRDSTDAGWLRRPQMPAGVAGVAGANRVHKGGESGRRTLKGGRAPSAAEAAGGGAVVSELTRLFVLRRAGALDAAQFAAAKAAALRL